MSPAEHCLLSSVSF